MEEGKKQWTQAATQSLGPLSVGEVTHVGSTDDVDHLTSLFTYSVDLYDFHVFRGKWEREVLEVF